MHLETMSKTAKISLKLHRAKVMLDLLGPRLLKAQASGDTDLQVALLKEQKYIIDNYG
jgi:hypothetical protein